MSRTFKYIGSKGKSLRIGVFLLPTGKEVVVDNKYIAARLAERNDVMEVTETKKDKKDSSPKEGAKQS